tara:strand:+ start:1623 stop:1952 length:330 start_codon:yes stop_codon:yes gene_type:complete
MEYDYERLLKITNCWNTVFDKRGNEPDIFLPFNEDLNELDERGKFYTIQPIVQELKLCDRFCEKYKSIKEDDEKHFDFFNYLMDKFTKTDKKGIWVSEYQEYKEMFLNI